MSTAKSNNVALAFSLLPSLVKLFEVFMGKGNGAAKKAAVTGVVTSIAVAGGSAVAAKNPQYADVIGQVIDATVAHFNQSGEMPTPIAQP